MATNMFKSSALLLACFGCSIDAAATNNSWEGIWAAVPKWCQYPSKIGVHDPAPIKINRHEIVGLENLCKVIQETRIANEIVLDLSCEGEGESYHDRIYVTSKGNKLNLRRDGQKTISFYRCPQL